MSLSEPTPLLGGLSPQAFMSEHWHKKPLLIRQAVPGIQPLLSRTQLFDLAAQEGVESRLITRKGADWHLAHGPFGRKAIPKLSAREWTLLVQGVDLHDDACRALLERFRFIGDARLDDLMISYASEGGGVGPHFDSYDVFLLQVSGQRRWRISAQQDLSLQEGKSLKILQNFQCEQEWVLEPGDMLYLPPQYAHDGVAETGDCMTYSVGFRAPTDAELAQEVMLRLGEYLADEAEEGRTRRYADPQAQAMAAPAAVPADLGAFAQDALQRLLGNPTLMARALGEVLTDLKPHVGFGGEGLPEGGWPLGTGAVLDRATRMLFDAQHIFVNGEAFVVGGSDGELLRTLANARSLTADQADALSEGAREVMCDWIDMGWMHVRADD